MCLLPALECLNGRMDETLCFLLSESKGKFFNYVGCQVLRQTVHVNIFVRSQTAINLFENTCEDILNLSKVAGNKNNNLPAIQEHFCVAIPDIRHNTLLIFSKLVFSKTNKVIIFHFDVMITNIVYILKTYFFLLYFIFFSDLLCPLFMHTFWHLVIWKSHIQGNLGPQYPQQTVIC